MANIRTSKGISLKEKKPLSKITSISTYKKLTKSEPVTVDYEKISQELSTLEYNINTFREIIDTLDPYLYLNTGTENDIPIPFEFDGKYNRIKRKTVECIYRTVNNSIRKTILKDSKLNVEYTENDIYWQIAEMEAISNFQWMKCFLTVIIDTVMQQIANIVYILANGIEKILKITFRILFIGICINIGIILKAALMRFVHYYVMLAIFKFEDLKPLNWIKYRNKKTGQTREENIYRKKLGSIADRVFYPYFDDRGWPLNGKNRNYFNSMQQVDAVMRNPLPYLFRVTIGAPKCKEITMNLTIEPPESVEKFTPFINAKETKLSNLIENCHNCSQNCYDGDPNNEYTELPFKAAASDLTQKLNSNLIENPYIAADEIESYDKCRRSLDEMQEQLNLQTESLGSFNILSDNFIPDAHMSKLTKFLIQCEEELKAIDKMLEVTKNGNYIELANAFKEAYQNDGSSSLYDKAQIKKDVLEKELKLLNNKLQFLQNRLVEVNTELAERKKAYDEAIVSYHTSPTSKNKQNIKVYESGVKEYENSLKVYEKEINLVLNDISTVTDKIKNNPPETMQKVSKENIVRNADSVLAGLIFVLDSICCVLSLLMLLGIRQFDNNKDAFKKINDNFVYKLLTGQDISDTSIYTTLQWTGDLINYVGNLVLTILSSGLNSTGKFKSKFEIDFNITKILTSVTMTTTFTVFDFILRSMSESIFAFVSAPKEESTWDTIPLPDSKSIFDLMSQETKLQKLYRSMDDVKNLAPQTDGHVILLYLKDTKESYPDEINNMHKMKVSYNGEAPKYIYVDVKKFVYRSTENIMDEFIEYLMNQKCMTINFILDMLLSYVRNFHLRLGMMAEILNYEPKFSIENEFDYETIGRRSSMTFMLDLLKMILKNLDFFVKFCRLQDDVELMAKLNTLVVDNTQIEKDKERYNRRYDDYIKSTPIGKNGTFDPELYDKNIQAISLLPVNAQEKIDAGELNDDTKKLLENLYKKYVSPDLPKENIAEEVKKSGG